MSSQNTNDRKRKSALELLRDTAGGEVVRPMARSAFEQIFGKVEQKFSGEIVPGQQVEFERVYSGEQKEKEKLERQLALERRLRKEEKVLVQKRTGELRIEITAIQEELVKLAKTIPNLSSQTEAAAILAPSDPTVYELFFLKRILSFIKNYRMQIEDASNWLRAANARAVKRNRWAANYKKYGAKYLLSGEHYLARSAG